ncbi:MAG: FtsX-like permease family protein [Thermofilaceae archaeon]|nr:FtsX-like permease family protein [Thermofilaceae archaeon]
MYSKLSVIASIVILATTFLSVILPELNKSFVSAETDTVTKVLEHFTQPDLFTVDQLDLSGEWKFIVRTYEEGVLEELYRPDAPVDNWSTLQVPFTFMASAANSTIWLRRDFQVPKYLKETRVRLVFLGAFYKAYVWLNGVYLGEHEGYFSPFYFDVKEFLNDEDVNTLVVCLSTPVEYDLDNKQGILGVFNDWDMKPYPRWALGRLPERYEWVVPIGLWKPVVLAASGPVAVTVVLVDAQPDQNSGDAVARFRFYVTNEGETTDCELRFVIKPYNFEGKEGQGVLRFSVVKGEGKWVEATALIPEAKIWWLWDQGTPHLYTLEYELHSRGELQGRGKVRFGVRSVRESRITRSEARFTLNGRRVFLRGFNYISDFNLLRASIDVLKRDIEIIVRANANFVRVHAHVEPFEFYMLADEKGIAVQADGPLIWAYASRLGAADYTRFLERVKKQFVEMVLLLYNNPSVVLWTVHNEPPWASEWMGELYRLGVNRDLDTILSNLISSLDSQGRPIISGSGYEDQHVYYGWFSGSWVDFMNDYSTFPTEFGAQSFPSPDSPFWSIVNVSGWPIRVGDDIYHELTYRGFYWASGYVKLPYGVPEEYASLRDYIEASQEYQALLLRTAITRYRTLKFNVTAGAAVFIFKDSFPAVSFSVVDYFGVPKRSYRVVADAFKPTKVLITWGGDFSIEGFDVVYEPNTSLKAEIWVANDFWNLTGSALLRWRLVDVNTSLTLRSGFVEVDLPRSDHPPRRALSLSMETPGFTDGTHVLKLTVSLSFSDGKIIDEEDFEFLVKPLGKVIVALNGSNKPLEFYIISSKFNFFIRSNGTHLQFALPAGVKASIYGPVIDPEEVYLPVALDIGSIKPGVTSISLNLFKGSFYVVKVVPSDLGRKQLPKIRLNLKPLTDFNASYMMPYSEDADILLALGLRGNTFVIPANTPVRVTCAVDGVLTLERELVLQPSETYVENELAILLVTQALNLGKRTLAQAQSKLAQAERQGFYAGLTSQMIREAQDFLEKAVEVSSSLPELAAALSQEAYMLLQNALTRLNEIRASTPLSLPALFLLLLLSSLGLAGVTVEDESKRPAVGTALLVSLGVLIYLTHPGVMVSNTMELFIGLYVSFFTLVALLLLPHLLEGVKSEKGVPIFSAAASALSIAARNLRRRGLRTSLALISIIAMTLAVTNLSSLNFYVASREIVTTARSPEDSDSALMIYSVNGLSLEDILYVSSQPEVREFGFKVESLPNAQPYAYVAKRAVRAYMSLTGYTPFNLHDAVNPETLTKLRERNDAVVVSSSWKSSGVEVGDTFEVGGLKLRVFGFFNESLLASLKDLGSHDFLPRVIYPDGTTGSAHPDEVIIVSADAALKLGGRISRIYVKSGNAEELKSLARRLSVQAGYLVVARPAGDFLRVYFTGPAAEFRGSEAIVPLALVFVNVASVVLASVYERKREIFTLASVGMNPTHILLVFVSEAVLLGFTGGSLGYVLGIAAFRVFQGFGAQIPVDVKTGLADMIAVVTLSVASSVAAALIPAMKASAYTTPSLSRKWRLEAEIIGDEWRVDIPARISAEKADQFAEYLIERLREEEHGIERAITNTNLLKSFDDSFPIYEVRFTYSRGGGKPFNAQTRLILRPLTQEFYGATLFVRPTSVYARFSQSYVQEVASFLRGIILEWASLRVRLMVPVGSSVTHVVELIRHYHPQLVVLVTRREGESLSRDVKVRLRNMGLRPPAVEVVYLKGRGIEDIVNEIRNYLLKVDIVALDSDDGLLSASIALAAALENRRVSIIKGGRIEEVGIDRLLKPL